MIGRAAKLALVLSLTLMARAGAAGVSNQIVSPRLSGLAISPPEALLARDGLRSPHHEGTEVAEDKPPPFSTIDNLPRDVAHSISTCWHPSHEGDEITLRMSFRSNGSVFGKPRITYMRAADGPDGQAALANSILAAIAACTPLQFTPSLGAAIAGRIFLIRFVALRKEQRASL